MQSQWSISAATTTTAGKQFYKPGRRPRVPLSCDPCRSRKLKCNREQPCQNCTTRDELASCKYKGARVGAASVPTPRREHTNEHVDLMQKRIDRLEGLVKTLMAQRQETPPSEDGTGSNNAVWSRDDPRPGAVFDISTGKGPSTLPLSGGTTVISGGHSIYKALDDWSDVLQEVNELKTLWNQSLDHSADNDAHRSLSHAVNESSFFSSPAKPLDIPEILESFPPKREVDMLIKKFFDRKNFKVAVAPILHEPTFMREYAEHWRDPSQTNIIWIGLLFSILGIVMLSYHRYDKELNEYTGKAEELFELYRLRTSQCLMIGDIAKCQPYTLETLRMNATAELSGRDDNSRGLWMMSGVIVRAAINMGYHREPLPSLAVLQGELRRRVWSSVVGIDSMASFLVGFPSMMPGIYSDTLEPRNLHDWELSTETTIIPPSRPLSEFTPVTYLVVKGRILSPLVAITDFNNTLRPESYHKVIELDTALYSAFANIPPRIKIHPDESSTALSMLQLEFLYHRGMCALHRKFLAKGRHDLQYRLSLTRCLTSAISLMNLQHTLMPTWYEISQAREVFTLAAMILCLELEHRRSRKGAYSDDGITPDIDSEALLRALETACELWKGASSMNEEAKKVYHVLNGMLWSFKSTTGSVFSRIEVPEHESAVFELPYPQLNHNQQLQMTPADDGGFLQEKNSFETPSNEMDIDWAIWDAFIEGASFEDTPLGFPFNDDDFLTTAGGN